MENRAVKHLQAFYFGNWICFLKSGVLPGPTKAACPMARIGWSGRETQAFMHWIASCVHTIPAEYSL
jgi:hypothetical protein